MASIDGTHTPPKPPAQGAASAEPGRAEGAELAESVKAKTVRLLKKNWINLTTFVVQDPLVALVAAFALATLGKYSTSSFPLFNLGVIVGIPTMLAGIVTAIAILSSFNAWYPNLKNQLGLIFNPLAGVSTDDLPLFIIQGIQFVRNQLPEVVKAGKDK